MALANTWHDPVTEIGSDGFQSFTKLPAATANLLLENDMYLKKRPVSAAVEFAGPVISTSSTSFVDVPGAIVNITTSGSSKLLILASGTTSPSSTANSMYVTVLVDGVNQGNSSAGMVETRFQHIGAFAITFLTAAAVSNGAHTVKLQCRVSAGTIALTQFSLAVMEVG